MNQLSGKINIICVIFLFTNILSLIAASKAEALGAVAYTDTQKPLPTLQETINRYFPDIAQGNAKPDAETYNLAVQFMLEMSENYNANSPYLFGFAHNLQMQVAKLQEDVRPDLKDLVYKHYMDSIYGTDPPKSSPSKFGYSEPANKDFYKQFDKLTRMRPDVGESYSKEGLAEILAALANAPEDLRIHMLEHDLSFVQIDPEHYDLLTQFAKRSLDSQGKISLAMRMLNYANGSDYGFLDLLKGNTNQKVLCSVLEQLSILKSKNGLDNLPPESTGRRNLVAYLQSLPSSVTCTMGNKIQTYPIESEIKALGAWSPGNGKKSTKSGSRLDVSKECPISYSLISRIQDYLKSIPKIALDGQPIGAFGSENKYCYLIVKSQRVHSPTGDDTYQVEMAYSYHGDKIEIPSKNLTRVQLMEFAKGWSPTQDSEKPVQPAAIQKKTGVRGGQ